MSSVLLVGSFVVQLSLLGYSVSRIRENDKLREALQERNLQLRQARRTIMDLLADLGDKY